MASAVLASQNESSWAHMGKNSYSNSHLNANPNPNPNPKKKQKQFHLPASNGLPGGRFHGNNIINHNLDSPAVTQAASDDAYSFNQTSTSRNAPNYGGYLSFNVAAYSKSELLELRKRLSAELHQIRDFQDRIEAGQFNGAENPRSQPKLKKLPGHKRPGAVDGSVPKNVHENGSFAVNFDGVLKECGKIVTKLIKHKFGYVFRVPVDAVSLGLHDYHQIVKRPMDFGTVKTNLAKGVYRTPMEFAADMRLIFSNALLYNPKNDPVNGMAETLLAKFEDLFRPVQEMIDGALVQQQRMEEQVREARVYNDESQFRGFDELQGSSWNNPASHGGVPSPVRMKKSKPKSSPVVPIAEVLKRPDRMQTHSSASTASNPPPMMNQKPFVPMLMPETLPPSPVRAPSPQFKEQKSVLKGLGPVKLPKPKAKDPNKRDMSVEEKQKLRMDLLSLPQDKMPQLVQKRNKQLAQDGDEIELDIEALDNETLWELDRFVTDWKKMVSKSKRQALMSNPLAVDIAPPASPSPSPIADAEKVAMSDKNDGDDDDGFGKKVRENEDEDVDIDDDMPAASFPPVEIEKDVGAGGVAGQDHDQNQEPGGGGDHNQGPVGGEGQAGPVYAPIVRRYRRLKIFKGGSPKPLRGLHLPDSSPSFDGDGPGPVDGHVDVSVEPTSDCKFKIAKGGYRKPLRGLVLPSLSPSRDRGRSGRKPKLAKEDSLEPLLFPGSPSFAGNLCLQKSVPIGHEHQVGAPPLVNDYKSNLVGTIIFPHEKGEKGEQEKGERGPIGEGRRGSCYCENPTSIECIKLHLSENNVGLQLDLGFAFEEWEFDKMPEFALEDWTKFGNLKKHSPPPPSGAKASKPAAVRYDRRSREKENAFTRKQWAVGCGDVRDVTSWANEAGAKKVTKATKAKAAAKNFVLYVDLKIDP